MDPVSWRQDVIMEQQEGCHTGTSLSTIANLCHGTYVQDMAHPKDYRNEKYAARFLNILDPNG